MDISALSSMYSDYVNNAADAATPNLKNNLSGDFSNASDNELMDVCKQFEAYFLEQVFKEMQKTIPKSESNSQANSTMLDYFTDSTIQEIAKQSTETQSLGLAQTLYEQMKRNYE